MDELSQMDAELEALATHGGGPRPLPAIFTIEATHDEVASTKAGRPIYRDVETIEIRLGRDVVRREVTDADRRAYAAQYLAWKKGESQEATEGFPLSQWAAIPGKAMVRELAHLGIRSVEQLAAATDATLQILGPYQGLRQKARDWMAQAEKQAPLIKIREENEALKQRLAALERMVGQQTKEIETARQSGGALPAAGGDDRFRALEAQIAALVQQKADPAVEPKRKGRPPGSKNKPKNGVEPFAEE